MRVLGIDPSSPATGFGIIEHADNQYAVLAFGTIKPSRRLPFHGKLNEIRFENYDIVISHSKNVVIAAIISTKKPEKLRTQLQSATNDIETQFGEKLSHWNGDRAELGEIDLLMKRFLAGKYRR